MESARKTIVPRAVDEVISTYPQGLTFPAGDELSIPTAAEESLLAILVREGGVTERDVESIRSQLNGSAAYALIMFVVRMAVLAARRREPRILTKCLFGLVCDDGLVDWRDILVALAVVENCADRVSVELDAELRAIAGLAVDRRRKTIVDGYLSRPAERRTLQAMGVKAEGSGVDLRFFR